MSATDATDAARRGTFPIGEVLLQLRTDFPDITISKIRFLEAEGLIEPERKPSGYRMFAPSDVNRLRYVLTQQRDHYLPLRVIKEQLAALDRGARPPGPGGVPRAARLVLSDPPDADDFRLDPAQLRLTAQQLCHSTGLREDQLAELEQFGLVSSGPAGRYGDDALAIAQVVAELARFGLEGRHLRAFRSAADREVGLFTQVVGSVAKQRNSEARARAQDTVRELAALSVQLHAALVRAGLREVTGGH
ncbi:MAG: MerR family transcriptional regulator [Actinomycetota bacterium]|nr:MerR family transcriptional regulator [Actinomycetota bacterium]